MLFPLRTTHHRRRSVFLDTLHPPFVVLSCASRHNPGRFSRSQNQSYLCNTTHPPLRNGTFFGVPTVAHIPFSSSRSPSGDVKSCGVVCKSLKRASHCVSVLCEKDIDRKHGDRRRGGGCTQEVLSLTLGMLSPNSNNLRTVTATIGVPAPKAP